MNEHPDDERILEYLQAPGRPEYQSLSLHLAECTVCRRRADTATLLRAEGEWIEVDSREPDPELVDLLDGRLDVETATRLRREIKQDPARLRAALHYASHSRGMRGLRPRQSEPEPLLQRVVARVGDFLALRTPLWQTVPAMALLLVIGVLSTVSLQTESAQIVALGDQPQLRFSAADEQPGIGFFSQQPEDVELFAGMRIELDDRRHLRLSWPAIDGASVYILEIQEFRDGQSRVLASQTLDQPSAEFEFEQPLGQYRYEWHLSGETDDQRSFQASGGFVVVTH